MPPPTIGGGNILFSGCPSDRPLTTVSRDVLLGGISMKHATNI